MKHHVTVYNQGLSPVSFRRENHVLHPKVFDQVREPVFVTGRHHFEFHHHVLRSGEVDQLRAQFVVGEVEHRRDVCGGGGVGDGELDQRRDVVAGGDGVDEGGDLHAMRGAQVDDVNDGVAFGDFEDGGIGGGEAESVPGG